MQTPPLTTWLLLISLGMIWGGSFPGNALALEGFGPITIAAFRICIGAVAVLALAIATGVGLPDRRTATGRRIWLHAGCMAVLSNALPFTLLGWAQQSVTSGFAGVSMAGVPLLVLPLAHFLVPGERLTRRKAAGFVMGFAGVVVLIGPDAVLAGGDSNLLPRAACIAAAACYACGGIVTRRAPAGPMLSFSAAALSMAAILMLPTALLLEGIPDAPPPQALVAVIYLGLLPTAVATLILVHIIKTAGPSFLSLVNYQVPVWALVMGVVLLGEAIPGRAVWALVLILGGLFVAQGRRRVQPVAG